MLAREMSNDHDPASNTHRVILVGAERPLTDFERLEEILAGAIGQAREALALLDRLPGECRLATRLEERALRGHVERRRLLSEKARSDVGAYMYALERWQAGRDPCPAIAAVEASLREARSTAERVADLIGAEQDIGWHRSDRTR